MCIFIELGACMCVVNWQSVICRMVKIGAPLYTADLACKEVMSS